MKVISCDCCGRKTALCGCEPDDVPQHYPGCHKVHIECANKKIQEAVPVMKWLDGLNGEVPWVVRNDAESWLESLGVEE